MFNLRQKLSFGFGGMLAIIFFLGIKSILLLSELGQSIDVILRENYRSVIACQDMKEAIERMDSGALFIMLDYEREGKDLISKNELKFEKALDVELNNITVPREGEKAERIKRLFSQYTSMLRDFENASGTLDVRRDIYFTKLFPLFQETKESADDVLQMNQQNMSDANDRARAKAESARQQMGILLFIGAIVAVSFIFFIRRWVLDPIKRLMQSAEDIKKGNLELFVQTGPHDEFGQLYEAFNDMAASLRQFRRSDQAKLLRIQQSTQQAFKSLPDVVAVIDLAGTVEVATESARNAFGLAPGVNINDVTYDWLKQLYHETMDSMQPGEAQHKGEIVQSFIQGKELFFKPKAVPIFGGSHMPTGVVLALSDVTQQQEHDDMKRGLVSTVSHQFKTPLTSIRMAIHLLLEEKVGNLNEKQAELLIAAREDSDRLNTIIEDLLDINRIESGKSQMSFSAVEPQVIVTEALGHFASAFLDKGIKVNADVDGDIPEVLADTTRIGHVFDNLISNALKYTAPGGTVTVAAQADKSRVVFSVSDTGSGIPKQHIGRIFDQFFRVPGQETKAGAGLGLAIALEIVQAHGGKITVESAEEKGTTFRVFLRRADIAQEGGKT